MAPEPESRAFTATSTGRARVLITDVAIGPSYQSGPPPPFKTFKAIWDTGATNTVVTPRVARECGLVATGIGEVHHADGSVQASTYIVNIRLPNKVEAGGVRVHEMKLNGDADVLIGMDIIGEGDFAVTNFNGKTVFSFRFPSMEHIDFVNQPPPRRPPKLPPVPPPKPPAAYPGASRNAPCPCGSGKKYKKCHGANA